MSQQSGGVTPCPRRFAAMRASASAGPSGRGRTAASMIPSPSRSQRGRLSDTRVRAPRGGVGGMGQDGLSVPLPSLVPTGWDIPLCPQSSPGSPVSPPPPPPPWCCGPAGHSWVLSPPPGPHSAGAALGLCPHVMCVPPTPTDVCPCSLFPFPSVTGPSGTNIIIGSIAGAVLVAAIVLGGTGWGFK